MEVGRLIRTVRWLRWEQVLWQVVNRLRGRVRYVAASAPVAVRGGMRVEPAAKPVSLCSEEFTFLNVRERFAGWDDRRHGMLWAYNLNYMDWLNQPEMLAEEGAAWIDRFIAGIDGNGVGTDPYPTALRLINWAKFLCRFPAEATAVRVDSMYAQARHLERRLERHLLGNHLLEDAYALFVAANYLGDDGMRRRAERLLRRELREQVLADGAHYEQSPMYHCILLDRLLDCINFDRGDSEDLRAVAVRMLGYLESICWADGSLPLLNDSAEGIAPTPAEIFAYARRLGLIWQAVPLRECGYRKLTSGDIELLADVGGIAAAYQPGHSHADALSYELRIGGRPVVVDTGISTYEKNERRQYERSTLAHNTVTPASGADSSEVWGGFRVGRRARVRIESESDRRIAAHHDGFGPLHTRTFELTDGGGVRVADEFAGGDAVSRIYLAPGVEVRACGNGLIDTSAGQIRVSGATNIELSTCKVSTQYNRFAPSQLVEIHFSGRMEYIISQ